MSRCLKTYNISQQGALCKDVDDTYMESKPLESVLFIILTTLHEF